MTTAPDPDADAEDATLRPKPSTAARPRPRRADAEPEQGIWRPEYIVVLSISPQMRARYPYAPLSLDEALRLGHRETSRAPEPDLEAEP